VEKEQFSEIIGPVQNEFDLLLLEAKGQSTIAEKVLMKWAADAGLPVFIFSDCDIAGHMIEQAIRKGSKRFPHPIETAQRIGLNLEDAQALDLLPENCTPEIKHRTWLITSDLPDESKSFLRTHRFELNHLSTGQMRDLLRRKLTEAGIQKPMPSPKRLMEALSATARNAIEDEYADELEEELARVRHEFYQRHGAMMNEFVEKVCAQVDQETLHAGTNELLQTVCRSGTWYGALHQYITTNNLIKKTPMNDPKLQVALGASKPIPASSREENIDLLDKLREPRRISVQEHQDWRDSLQALRRPMKSTNC
jgi:hypothetical protein